MHKQTEGRNLVLVFRAAFELSGIFLFLFSKKNEF